MQTRTFLVPVLLLAASTPMVAQEQVPAALQGLKPHQIVEAVSAEQGSTLHLTSVQIRRLDSLHVAVRSEPHKYEPSPSMKAHQNVRMQPMISKRRAYADAMAILTPEQRAQAQARFDEPTYQLPANLQKKAAQEDAGDPLQHHAAGARPADASTDSSPADPLEHHKGTGAPSSRAVDSGQTAPNPETHK